MLTKKENELLDFFKKYSGEWINSKRLAEFCKCTTRTIRNRVVNINKKIPKLILANNLGYQLNKDVLIPNEAAEDHKSLVFLELLKHSSSGINIFELSDKLFVSESTLKKDIKQLKKEITNDEIQIVLENNLLKLTGTEQAKRSYLISSLYNESDIQEKLKLSIQKMIGYISMDDIQLSIQEVMTRHKIKINEYSLNNITLHYAISIERIRQGHELKKNIKIAGLHTRQEYIYAKEIAEIIEEQYSVHFSNPELQQLSILFIGLQNENLTDERNNELSNFVDIKIINVLRDVLTEVEQVYLVKFQEEGFFTKLAIHIQNLYYRSFYESFNRNSSLLDIKTAYPLTYDLAIYISSLIQERLDFWFNEDEISFIALHIGAFLEIKKNRQRQFLVYLIINDYHNIGEQLQNQIQAKFSDDAEITLVKRETADINLCDLLLTTDRKIALKYAGSVFINTFLTSKDEKKIERRIENLKSKKIKMKMYKAIQNYIMPDLFFNQIDPTSLTPIEIRHQLCKVMEDKGFVDEFFLEDVEKRELMSSTSFPSGIAIPHSINLEAKKSGIAIMTLQEPIMWSSNFVKIVAFIAISKVDASQFNQFFENFISIVSESVNITQLTYSEDYDEFILKLKAMVDTDE